MSIVFLKKSLEKINFCIEFLFLNVIIFLNGGEFMSKDVRKALTENLNELIKIKGIKSIDLAESVGVSKSAVSHWLAGDNSPNIEILAKICQIYNVKLSDMLNEKIEATYADKEILRKYHKLDKYGKRLIDNSLEIEYERCTAIISQEHQQNIVSMPFYESTRVSAGTGWYDEHNEYPSYKQVPRTPVTQQADFCCYVSGDSMEPEFYDGDLIFVKKQSSVKIGEIGIFVINGEMFVKKLGETGLISLNPEYDLIKKSPDIICQGKVLGKI